MEIMDDYGGMINPTTRANSKGRDYKQRAAREEREASRKHTNRSRSGRHSGQQQQPASVRSPTIRSKKLKSSNKCLDVRCPTSNFNRSSVLGRYVVKHLKPHSHPPKIRSGKLGLPDWAPGNKPQISKENFPDKSWVLKKDCFFTPSC